MASRALHRSTAQNHKSLAKRMSTHVAYGLVVYTLLLFFVVAPGVVTGEMAIWPYLLLVAFVAVAILPCRNLERKWQNVVGSNGGGQFWRDAAMLWLGAMGIPLAVMLLIRTLS